MQELELETAELLPSRETLNCYSCHKTGSSLVVAGNGNGNHDGNGNIGLLNLGNGSADGNLTGTTGQVAGTRCC
jgi:hypothetical protein